MNLKLLGANNFHLINGGHLCWSVCSEAELRCLSNTSQQYLQLSTQFHKEHPFGSERVTCFTSTDENEWTFSVCHPTLTLKGRRPTGTATAPWRRSWTNAFNEVSSLSIQAKASARIACQSPKVRSTQARRRWRGTTSHQACLSDHSVPRASCPDWKRRSTGGRLRTGHPRSQDCFAEVCNLIAMRNRLLDRESEAGWKRKVSPQNRRRVRSIERRTDSENLRQSHGVS